MKSLLSHATKTVLLATLLSTTSLVAMQNSAMAKQTQHEKTLSSQQSKKVQKAGNDKASEKRKAIISEAINAIRETENALKALDKNKPKDALAALEKATGKLNVILARDPGLALAPVAVNSAVYDVIGDIKAINALKKKTIKLLEKGRVQEARHIIQNLASERVISVTNIPLATYPAAIKAVVKLIDAGKTEEAKAALQTALDTLVITKTIIPLPVTAARVLLEEAEKLAEKKSRSAKENHALEKLLEAARKELEFAEALGYGSKKDFEHLYQEMKTITEKTSAGKHGTGFFDKIKGFLKDAIMSSQGKK